MTEREWEEYGEDLAEMLDFFGPSLPKLLSAYADFQERINERIGKNDKTTFTS